jgi:hypothetical protein
MEIPYVTRKVRSWKGLERLVAGIERGDEERPDWIELRGDADPAGLSGKAWEAWLPRLHAAALRGFLAPQMKIKGRKRFLAFWQRTARAGFHDFADGKWTKPYGAQTVTDYDYIRPYQEGGLAALDPYAAYSAVLGTWDYTVEDFLNTEVCADVRTIVEPLAGTAEFCYQGHWRYPDLRYVMFDLDPDAKKLVDAHPWLPQTQRAFLLGNALDEDTWKRVRAASEGPSLAYIGKQSQNFFDTPGMMKILEWGTRHADHLMLEVSEPYLVEDEPTVDDLTRREMKAVGLSVVLEDLDDVTPNPLTNHMSFELVASDDEGRRVLFNYHDWTGWQPPTLSALGQLLGLKMHYFHGVDCEFLPLDQGIETSDVRENNSFMLFSRP